MSTPKDDYRKGRSAGAEWATEGPKAPVPKPPDDIVDKESWLRGFDDGCDAVYDYRNTEGLSDDAGGPKK